MAGEGLVDHSRPDQGEQAKGDPVVDPLDINAHGRAGKPAEDGHHRLKEAEGKTDFEPVRTVDLRDTQPAKDRDRQGVHGETDGDENEGV